jgi:hypothetical protein
MARHGRSVDERARVVRVTMLVVIWLGGLAAGLFALLAAAAKYGCAPAAGGLGCTTSGSLLGFGLVLVVIAVVTTVTVLTFDREPQRSITVGVLGLVALLACFLVAQGILGTV